MYCLYYIIKIKVVVNSEVYTDSHVMIAKLNGHGISMLNIWGMFFFLKVSREKLFLNFKIFSEVSKSSYLSKNESLLFEENTLMLSLA